MAIRNVPAVPANSHGATLASVSRVPASTSVGVARCVPLGVVASWAMTSAARKIAGIETTTVSRAAGRAN